MNTSLFSTESIRTWREGSVTNDIVTHLGCCVPRHETEEVFRYIEVLCEDGRRLFVYEDTEGFERFEEDFYSRRFTSFHEFWTTEATAKEDRGAISLKYFLRRPKTDYIRAPLEDARTLLKPFRRLTDRITVFHQYDRRVNYHYRAEDLA